MGGDTEGTTLQWGQKWGHRVDVGDTEGTWGGTHRGDMGGDTEGTTLRRGQKGEHRGDEGNNGEATSGPQGGREGEAARSPAHELGGELAEEAG